MITKFKRIIAGAELVSSLVFALVFLPTSVKATNVMDGLLMPSAFPAPVPSPLAFVPLPPVFLAPLPPYPPPPVPVAPLAAAAASSLPLPPGINSSYFGLMDASTMMTASVTACVTSLAFPLIKDRVFPWIGQGIVKLFGCCGNRCCPESSADMNIEDLFKKPAPDKLSCDLLTTLDQALVEGTWVKRPVVFGGVFGGGTPRLTGYEYTFSKAGVELGSVVIVRTVPRRELGENLTVEQKKGLYPLPSQLMGRAVGIQGLEQLVSERLPNSERYYRFERGEPDANGHLTARIRIVTDGNSAVQQDEEICRNLSARREAFHRNFSAVSGQGNIRGLVKVVLDQYLVAGKTTVLELDEQGSLAHLSLDATREASFDLYFIDLRFPSAAPPVPTSTGALPTASAPPTDSVGPPPAPATSQPNAGGGGREGAAAGSAEASAPPLPAITIPPFLRSVALLAGDAVGAATVASSAATFSLPVTAPPVTAVLAAVDGAAERLPSSSAPAATIPAGGSPITAARSESTAERLTSRPATGGAGASSTLDALALLVPLPAAVSSDARAVATERALSLGAEGEGEFGGSERLRVMETAEEEEEEKPDGSTAIPIENGKKEKKE